jgi:NhaA family Na+:H+ antiporter
MESPNQSLGPIKKLQSVLHSEVGPGILLVIMAVLAMTIMNSPLASYYEDVFRTKVVFGIGPIVIDKPFLLWVNDGLMAIFFFLIGLEIKRELMVGHLSDIRQAFPTSWSRCGRHGRTGDRVLNRDQRDRGCVGRLGDSCGH